MTREGALSALVNVALQRAQLAHHDMYVWCTSTQWVIGDRPPDFDRAHIRVESYPPQAVMCDYDFMAGRWSERVISTPAPGPEPDGGEATEGGGDD